MSKSDAITWYEPGTATLAVPFPNGKTVCQWCPYVRTEDSLKRHRVSDVPFHQPGQRVSRHFR